MQSRPLYRAINKYGIENFKIEEIIQCRQEQASEKEKYYIQYYNTYYNGYNATLGGDGTIYIERQPILIAYKQLQNCQAVAKKLKISVDTVRTVLKNNEIKIISSSDIAKRNSSKSVKMLDLNDNIICIFNSVTDAATYIQKEKQLLTNIKGITVHIRNVCNKKRKTAYSYKWQWNI